MFVTFEGPEGSGKSSQISRLKSFLDSCNIPVLVTREPGGTAIGDQIRDVLHDVNNRAMQAETEFLLYSASRSELVREVILPALKRGEVVLCDRYADSTLAYQGYGRELPLITMQNIINFATQGLTPDLTFLLDIDVERGLARRVHGNEEMNRLDLEEVAFHKRVRQGYHILRQENPQRWCVIDADRTADEVQTDLQRILIERIGINKGID